MMMMMMMMMMKMMMMMMVVVVVVVIAIPVLKHYSIKTHGGIEVRFHVFFNLATNCDKW
jgi:hypothetical protein